MELVGVRLEPELIRLLDAWAASAGRKRSEAVRFFIEHGVAHKPPTAWAKKPLKWPPAGLE
jgi:hypothetical protein